jgi:sugar lactone lactonase YvrE
MNIRLLLTTASAVAMLSLAAPAFAADSVQIAFTADTAYPESVTWSAKQHSFMVSSVRQGVVGKVSTKGEYTPFITDKSLVSSVGLLVDDKSNTLWVTNSDPGASEHTDAATQGKLAGLAAYDATSGERKAYYDLGSLSEGIHFANDLTLDANGNVYVTDSFAPIIYKIDTAGKASIFAKNALFKDADGFNLNGIAWHKDGYLLVGKYNSGALFRVNLADPSDVSQVQLPEALKGADGLHLVDDQHLIIVQNMGSDRTVELVSTDGWKTAKVERELKSIMSMPTAATDVDGSIYVLNSRLDTLFDPKAKKVSDYTLQKF